MQSFRDAKRMAKALKATLRDKNVTISHSESLDIVAQQFGANNWNVLSARIKRSDATDHRRTKALKSWDFISAHPSEFDHGLDHNVRDSGSTAALIRYAPSPNSSWYPDISQVFATYSQTVSAVPYLGKRLAIEARLATEAVSHGATIWVRIDRAPGHVLAFENLKDKQESGWLFGDHSWTKRSIVIDVSTEAVSLFFGFFLKGKGSVWADSFAIDTANSVPHLAASHSPVMTSEPSWITPTNLDFTKVLEILPA